VDARLQVFARPGQAHEEPAVLRRRSRAHRPKAALTLGIYSHVLPQADREAADRIAALVPLIG